MRAIENDWDLLPTEEDVRSYEERGWYRSGTIFSEEEIDSALAAVERHYEGHRDHSLRLDIHSSLDWNKLSHGELRVNNFIVQQNDTLGSLATKPVIGAIAARLTRARQIRLLNSALFYKSPSSTSDATKIGWHTDSAYWQTCSSRKLITAWIALHDVDENMGPLTVLDCSNRWPEGSALDALRRERSFVCDDIADLEERLGQHAPELRHVPLCPRKGQVSFHSCLTFHGSGLNISDRPRINLTVHLQDESNRYRRMYDDKGKLCVYNMDHLVRRTPEGIPDYSDPRFCPVIWPEQCGE